VIHPFHPLCGREFELVTRKKAWGEDRVYFRDESGRLHHMPVGWTSIVERDAFSTTAADRCRFRTDDLLRLAHLVDTLRGDADAGEASGELRRACKGKGAAPTVRRTRKKGVR